MVISERYCVFFFFQAEDGIRDLTVTGVQTCALPILTEPVEHLPPLGKEPHASAVVPLVEIEPGFLPRGDVDLITDAVFDDLERSVDRCANDRPGARGEPFELASFGIGALVDPRAAAPLAEDRDQ